MRIFCRLYLPVVLLIILVSGVRSQEVLSSGGGYEVTTSGSVSWSIGEPIIETLSGTGGVMTQGMQQPNVGASVVAEPMPIPCYLPLKPPKMGKKHYKLRS